ncbi:hypothetical protein MCEGE10_00530 [Flavobacteriaceae bacterium]
MKIYKSLLFSVLLFSGIANAQIGIGTKVPDGSSVLDMSSNDKGVLFPRMITGQRDAIVAPATGLMIYNLTTNAVEVNTGIPPAKNWISVTGATGPQGASGVVTTAINNAATANGALALGGAGNQANGVFSAAIGGANNKAVGDNSVAFGGANNTATGTSSSAIGGTSNNAVSANSNALGGSLNSVTGVGASALGGLSNITVGAYSSVIGGASNKSGAPYSSVVGGSYNTASGDSSSVIGGIQNNATGPNSGVFAGTFNEATADKSGVVGGNHNHATGVDAVVFGGTYNSASAAKSGVFAGTTNVASGVNAIVLGGADNTANGINAVISGGTNNTAIGDYSVVSGGVANTAKSYGEWVGGLYGTDYLVGSTTAAVATDRLFNLGNGTLLEPSDAFTILKNGLAMLPKASIGMLTTASGTAIITKNFADNKYAMKTTVPVVAPLKNGPGTIGEIRITAQYIYAYIGLTEGWVRFENDNLGW